MKQFDDEFAKKMSDGLAKAMGAGTPAAAIADTLTYNALAFASNHVSTIGSTREFFDCARTYAHNVGMVLDETVREASLVKLYTVSQVASALREEQSAARARKE